MAAIGRDLLLEYSTDGGTTYTTLAGVISKSVAINQEPVDVTTDDADGWRTLLAEPGTRSVDLSVSGVTESDYLREQITVGTSSVAFEDIRITYPNGDTITGSFFLNSLTETGETTAGVTFEGSLQSSGEITYTAA